MEGRNCPFSDRCSRKAGALDTACAPAPRRTSAQKPSLRRPWSYLRIFGSGLITGASNDDPANVAAFTQAGARFGNAFLWITLFTYPLLAAVQEASARIGAVTGRGLSGNIRQHYRKTVVYTVAALAVFANTINLGADIGMMGAAAQLLIPLPFEPVMLAFTALILALQLYMPYGSYVRVLKWLSLFLLAYPLTLIVVGGSWKAMLLATLWPRLQLDFDFIFMLSALIGTTISPYMMFWQAAELVEDEIDQGMVPRFGVRPRMSANFLRSMRIDTLLGMFFSQLPCWAITAVSAQVFFHHGTTDIPDAAEAARALEPLVYGFPYAGQVARSVFALGIIGVGLLSVPVFAGGAAYALADAIGCRMGLYLPVLKAPCFYSVIVGAMVAGLLFNFFHINPIKALIFASVLNGICAIPLIYLIARIARKETVMGKYRSGPLSHVMLWITFCVMALSLLALLASYATG
jgi:Mn2+/Fe2+ NRAMP family transporter